MDKTEFYKNRILWKADKHNLFEKRCLNYSGLTSLQMMKIQVSAPKGIPVLVFWNDNNLWTVLTTEEVLSMHDNSLFRVNLDDINQEIKIEVDEGVEKPKSSTNFLIIGKNKIKIWVFAGEELFALYNTLRMFPLKKSK